MKQAFEKNQRINRKYPRAILPLRKGKQTDFATRFSENKMEQTLYNAIVDMKANGKINPLVCQTREKCGKIGSASSLSTIRVSYFGMG